MVFCKRSPANPDVWVVPFHTGKPRVTISAQGERAALEAFREGQIVYRHSSQAIAVNLVPGWGQALLAAVSKEKGKKFLVSGLVRREIADLMASAGHLKADTRNLHVKVKEWSQVPLRGYVVAGVTDGRVPSHEDLARFLRMTGFPSVGRYDFNDNDPLAQRMVEVFVAMTRNMRLQAVAGATNQALEMADAGAKKIAVGVLPDAILEIFGRVVVLRIVK